MINNISNIKKTNTNANIVKIFIIKPAFFPSRIISRIRPIIVVPKIISAVTRKIVHIIKLKIPKIIINNSHIKFMTDNVLNKDIHCVYLY